MIPLCLLAESVVVLYKIRKPHELSHLLSCGGGDTAGTVAREHVAIFSFRDSLSDTGNLCVDGIPDYLATARLPYGMTYFGYRTGASPMAASSSTSSELGRPLLPPSKTKNATFHRGANFAITGATALDLSFFQERGLDKGMWRSGSLHTQIKCSAQACRELSRRSLFIVGEFGGNDYGSTLFAFRPLSKVHALVLHVVASIGRGVEALIRRARVIKHGAKTVVVSGIPPLGCSPPNLAMFPSADPAGYDPRTGCLKQLNDLSVYHNSLLQEAIGDVETKRRNVRVICADFFTPIMQIVESPEKLGLTRDILRVCCGGGGKYNFNISAGCGMPGSTVCRDPSAYLYWDGHFTEAAYRYIAGGWLNTINNCKHY
ncbi:hypothetical protein BS78_03G016400 [Paspalum vaginatum]|nr:hypothetical protein BS78_03G016400 [Paspalum vaginatum]